MIGKLGKEVKALKKILIVEDDQLLNRTLAYNLTSDGYEVISVFNFDSAVRKLRENEFDVALLDINLPDGSGLDLCEEIRNRGQHTYIMSGVYFFYAGFQAAIAFLLHGVILSLIHI